jgi:RNA polymerase sigma factor (sigma-70 family)
MTLVDVEAVLVSEHGRGFALAYLLCGESSTAEEIAADCLGRVWARCQKGDVADPAAYLRRAIANEVTSVFRRRRVERRATSRLAGAQAVVPDHTAQSSDRAELRASLQQLPPRQRVAIVLRYFDDLSDAAIATAMGTSVGTTKAHLSRGLATLRALLEHQEDE